MSDEKKIRIKDPQPSVDRIEDLARRILDGDIILPKFQRGFVWSRSQIIELLDSVMKNYPIGSVLLWQSKQELMSEETIADLESRFPRPDYPVNYLLDGQQRLSTVCGALFWKGSNKNSKWNIAYDLKSKKFYHVDHLDDLPPTHIRLNKLQDPSMFFKQVSAISSDQKSELEKEADALFTRFKDYKIATVTLGDMEIQEVAPIFERINSTGTSLTIVDLMRAATWSPGFDLIDSIDRIKESLEDKSFLDVDQKNILRVVSACSSDGYSAESIDKLRAHTDTVLKEAFLKANEGYKYIVDFLKTDLNIPTFNALPYSNQLVVLVHLAVVMNNSLNAEDYRLLKSWFWRTSFSGYFGGWNTGDMGRDYDLVKAYPKSRKLYFGETLPKSDIWIKKQFRSNNAVAKMYAIYLSSRRPRDLVTGNIIDTEKSLHWKNTREFHHFFPKDFLKSKGHSSNDINCLANIIYLSSSSNKIITNRAPSEYLKNLERSHSASTFRDILLSNMISEEAYEAAKHDDYQKFLDIRANVLQDEIIKKIEL